MRIPILTFGAIASVLTINSVVADTTVTSKQYVDTTRQATIPAAGTNAATPGTTVVTYTNTAGTIGERAIFDPDTNFDYENNEVATGHEGDLVTAESIFPAVGILYQSQTGPANTVAMYNPLGQLGGPGGSRGIYDGSTTYDSSTDADKLVTASVVQNVSNNLPETTVTYKTCYQEVNGDCILWNLSDKNVYGHECETSSDCPCSGGYYGCNNGRCDIDGGCMGF